MAQKKVGGIIRRAQQYMAHSSTASRGGASRSGLGNTAKPFGALTTIYLIGDTHYGVENNDMGNPNDRQVFAINNLPGTPHPLGGFVLEPAAVIQVGDAVHEDAENMTRFIADYKLNGSGNIHYPCYVFDGNHDRTQVRNHIISVHGSLNWGVKIGPCWFQAVTENYTAPSNSTPPTVAQLINIDTLLAARPPGEPFFIMFHRSVSGQPGGYQSEWNPTALNVLKAILDTRNCKGIIHGHDHYSWHGEFRGYKTISPGSVSQSPVGVGQIYSTTYPESIVILRISETWYDIASYVFGFTVNRQWAPGTWEWNEIMEVSMFHEP